MSDDEINDMISATAKSIEEKDKVIEEMSHVLYGYLYNMFENRDELVEYFYRKVNERGTNGKL